MAEQRDLTTAMVVSWVDEDWIGMMHMKCFVAEQSHKVEGQGQMILFLLCVSSRILPFQAGSSD